MGFYAQVILPRAIDWVMSGPSFARYRQQVLAGVAGNVLEIGFGTGLNLPYYPDRVERLTAIDPNAGMGAIARRRLDASPLDVRFETLSSESLPVGDRTFDSAVCTWTLCSIANVGRALQEIRRTLKPGGSFHFIEHGLSREPLVQKWQHRLNPLQKLLFDGCHLNRDIAAIVTASGLQIQQLEEFYFEGAPKPQGYMYRGVAIAPEMPPEGENGT